LNEGWLKFMPGYFPARITIDAALTSIFDTRHELIGALVYALCLGLLTSGVFWRATRVYAGSLEEEKRMAKRRWAVVSGGVLLLTLAIGYVALPYINQGGTVEAKGQVVAPNTTVVSLASGKVRNLSVEPGDQLEAGQQLGAVEDWQTGEWFVFRAPMSSTVTRVNARTGESVLAGSVLLTVHDLNHLEVRLDVEEVFIAQVAIGQRVTVMASGLHNSIEGQVVSVGLAPIEEQQLSGNKNQEIKKYPVKVVLKETGGLRAGMSVRGLIHTMAGR